MHLISVSKSLPVKMRKEFGTEGTAYLCFNCCRIALSKHHAVTVLSSNIRTSMSFTIIFCSVNNVLQFVFGDVQEL